MGRENEVNAALLAGMDLGNNDVAKYERTGLRGGRTGER